MFDLFLTSGHRYSLAATGIKFHTREFISRQVAEKNMYSFLNKHGIRVEKIYDDRHFKTYCCNDNIRFYINRVY